MDRKKLVFKSQISELECTVVINLKLLELLDVELPNVSHEVFIDRLVPKAFASIRWEGRPNNDKIDIFLELLGGQNNIVLACFGFAVPS